MAVPRNAPPLVAAVAVLLLVLAAAAPAYAPKEPRARRAFLPSGGEDNPKPILERLDARPQLALGLVSATQGRYSPEQAVLDMSAGSRTSAAVYDPSDPPPL